MVTKFNEVKEKSIVWCIVDNLEKCESNWAREIAINLTDFMINRIDLYRYDIVIGKDEDEILQEVCKDYSHAVVVSSGMSFKLSERIFTEVEKLCKTDFFIAGHVLHRNENSHFRNAYYELHHQFYVINLKEYTELNCPAIGQPANEEHIQIEPLRSKECLYNDHEVAVWIKQGTELRTYNQKLHGWNIISRALENNKTLIDLGQGIRDNKKYLYFEYDHVFLRQLPSMYHNQFFCNNFFMPFNSDKIPDDIDFNGPVEQYITIGTGLNWVSNLVTVGFTDYTKVIFTDINNNCLNFMKSLVEEWDGNDYVEFYKSKQGFLPNNTAYDISSYYLGWEKQWNDFRDQFEDWNTLWNTVKHLSFEFILIDYTSSYNFNWIDPSKNTLMNLSDVFNHVPYITTQSLKYRIACENRLLSMLSNKNPNITLMLTSRAANGFINLPAGVLKITEFELTDITTLKKPQWHESDWGSSKMLG